VELRYEMSQESRRKYSVVRHCFRVDRAEWVGVGVQLVDLRLRRRRLQQFVQIEVRNRSPSDSLLSTSSIVLSKLRPMKEDGTLGSRSGAVMRWQFPAGADFLLSTLQFTGSRGNDRTKMCSQSFPDGIGHRIQKILLSLVAVDVLTCFWKGACKSMYVLPFVE